MPDKKVVLFLYPNKTYLDFEVQTNLPFFQRKHASPEKVAELYSQRLEAYRKKDYHIVWLFWGKNTAPLEPDTSDCDPRFGLCPEDGIMSCGIPLPAKGSSDYPNPKHIFELLCETVGFASIITLGDFHRTDCVERLYTYAQTLPKRRVFVDDDLTNLLFARMGLKWFYPEDAGDIMEVEIL